jgi:ribosomal protein S15P/S13E
LSRGKDKTVSKEEIGAMAENSVQPGELVATPEDQHLCHKIKKHRLHLQGHNKDKANSW